MLALLIILIIITACSTSQVSTSLEVGLIASNTNYRRMYLNRTCDIKNEYKTGAKDSSKGTKFVDYLYDKCPDEKRAKLKKSYSRGYYSHKK